MVGFNIEDDAEKNHRRRGGKEEKVKLKLN